MDASYEIVIANTAFIDIQQALDFVANVSPAAAKKLGEEIKKTILSLTQFPYRFEQFGMPNEVGHDFRRAVIERRYFLVYAIKDGKVIVERLLDARQGFAALV